MNNFLKLKLPANPVKDMKIIEAANIQGGYNLAYPNQILTDEMFSIFKEWGIRPKFVTLFGRNDHDGSMDTRLIHTDIALNKEGQWKKLLFGINWEITGHHNIFSWWDMSRVPEVWPGPEESIAKKYDYLNGIHYVSRLNMGVPEGAAKIEEVVIDTPTLVRTDLPHATVYKPTPDTSHLRVGLSIRFFEDDFSSWEDVYKFFEKYSV
jgi:hypothetical protein